MNEVKSHKDLMVWKQSMDLVIIVYKLTDKFPRHEQFSLTSQMRRASVSVPSNISEGAGRKSNKEFMRFLYISLGSLAELETQLEIAKRLEYVLNVEEVFEKMIYIRRMLSKLIKSIQ